MKNRTSTNPLSLGEGNTSLIRLINLEKTLNWKGEIWAKAEYQNPTGSFKDRGSITEISEAIRLNKRGVVCASTGNMAASLSAYATRVNLDCFIVIPDQTPPAKLRQAVICGAKLMPTKGSYDACVLRAKTIALKNNLLLCGDYKLRRTGQRTVGVELAQSSVRFDAFIVPVGNGTLGCAISEGFALCNQYPSFIGVQGQGADPIYSAWKKNSLIIPTLQPKTIASAMNVGNPLDGNLTLEWVRKTKGSILSVSNKEMIKAQNLLAKTEGIFVELAGAASVASLIKITRIYQRMVLILTGSGLKENTDSKGGESYGAIKKISR